ncbi:hypothetical protein VTN96DRAFT_5902 [Rasamsonia emersonii]|uniref:alpha-galactosidase n=1 Tax=Rasamsonia emersonii (strain ATCC 16479 / CBS 393.64 / IMI 116815) TaxID=1408163 RepID=A0A0F4YLT6_RASE3|nr:Endo alpha-1,4 polygalactosaminidase [Rasamsonia emersonii CBS 393.64]KKA19085.1 Endo alpha-1,4 polygalactosaminidase [Rasamsonia emersonii CBS 393.64]
MPLEKPFLHAGTAGWRTWSTRKKILVVSLVLLLILAIAIGLGVGLGVGLNNNNNGEEQPSTPTPSPTPPSGINTTTWQPKVRTTWQIELLYPLNDTSVDAEVYDIDLFNNTVSTIQQLHALKRRVICYFSAGSYEDWRPDADQFKSSDLGKTLQGWSDEKWLDIRSSNVRRIMTARLDLAREKGCDGVDPDNVDGYDNDNGLHLTQDDSIDYVNFLADEAHARNLSIGLKNAGDIIPSVIGKMQWSVNEQCAQYQECDTYAAFIDAGKPVFHIEYPKGDDTNNDLPVSTGEKIKACSFEGAANFSTIIKNIDLDNWIQTC